jgi:hypothetical protein
METSNSDERIRVNSEAVDETSFQVDEHQAPENCPTEIAVNNDELVIANPSQPFVQLVSILHQMQMI